MTKIKIVIASILKPVDDTRMFGKFGISLSQTNKYEINIIGFSSKRIVSHQNINFFPLFNFSRLSLQRIIAPWKYYKKLVQLKPELIIVNTYELLIVSICYKILFGAELLYDVQENYVRNIRYANTFPPIIKELIAMKVGATECLSRPWVSHYILAEKGYREELKFSHGKHTVIENKFKNPQNPLPKKEDNSQLRLLYSGTIAEHYGIFEAIDLSNQIKAYVPETTLTIIGYCAHAGTLKKILKTIEKSPHIRLIGGQELVPHSEVVEAIIAADFGLISYRPNKSTENCIPTRIYEYLALQLPMIVQNHPPWVKLCNVYKAGILFTFGQNINKNFIKELKERNFYPRGVDSQVFWESEEIKLLSLVEKCTASR